MDTANIIIAVVGSLFGSGVTWIFTLRSVKQKSSAQAELTANEAKSKELDNIQEAIKTYRELAEDLRAELKASNDDRAALREELEASKKERENTLTELNKVKNELERLTKINKRICALLEKIEPENYSQIIDEIKKQINETTK